MLPTDLLSIELLLGVFAVAIDGYRYFLQTKMMTVVDAKMAAIVAKLKTPSTPVKSALRWQWCGMRDIWKMKPAWKSMKNDCTTRR